MIGYDFDKTIYDGDSSTHFFFYMVFHRPYLLIFAPYFLIMLAFYAMKLISKKRIKELLFFFVPWHKNIEKIVNKFWQKHANKIFDWYCTQKKDDDLIISASLDFLLRPIMETLAIKNWMSTKYDVKTGKINGENCYGEEKLNRFNLQYKDTKLEAFYSDSMSDLPMMKVAKEAYLVKNKKPQKIEI